MKAAYFFFVGLLLGSLLGCDFGSPTNGPQEDPSRPSASTTIRVLVIDDTVLAKNIENQWKARASEKELIVRTATEEELRDAQRLSADVVIFPARELGRFAEEELIQPIPESLYSAAGKTGEEVPAIAVDDFLPTIRQCDISWGRKPYAVTLGSPQFVLLYRPDVFAKLDLSAPKTWDEYAETAKTLSDRERLGDLAPPKDKPWYGTLEPTAKGWAGSMLLARAASAVRTQGQQYTLFDVDQAASRIGSLPFVKAMQEFIESTPKDKQLSPEEVRQAFYAGESAMAITWPIGGEEKPSVPIAFAELPGRTDYYSFQDQAWNKKGSEDDTRASFCGVSGRLAAVTREARRSKASFQFLAWLVSGDTVQALGPANPNTTLFARSQLTAPGPWLPEGTEADVASQYASVAEAAFTRTNWMPTVRIPGASEYLAALDEAVAKSIQDPDKAEENLAAAAKAWDEITQRRGAVKQRRAYQRSLWSDF